MQDTCTTVVEIKLLRGPLPFSATFYCTIMYMYTETLVLQIAENEYMTIVYYSIVYYLLFNIHVITVGQCIHCRCYNESLCTVLCVCGAIYIYSQ